MRIAKESVDGLLIRNRYDDKAKTLQRGIGQEMAKHTQEIYDVVEKKKQLSEKTDKQIAERRAQEEKLVEIDRQNFMSAWFGTGMYLNEIQGILKQHDYEYREDRDYKARSIWPLKGSCARLNSFKPLSRILNGITGRVFQRFDIFFRRISAKRIHRKDTSGCCRHIRLYAALNIQLEKNGQRSGEYVLDMAGLPVKVAQLVQMVGELMNRTRLLTGAAERILFPEKYSFRRDSNAVYDFTKLTSDVISILMHQ